MKKPAKKLYKVQIGSIEDGEEFQNYNSEKVIAVDALSAAKRVRLTSNKRTIKFISSIELISEIDKP